MYFSQFSQVHLHLWCNFSLSPSAFAFKRRDGSGGFLLLEAGCCSCCGAGAALFASSHRLCSLLFVLLVCLQICHLRSASFAATAAAAAAAGVGGLLVNLGHSSGRNSSCAAAVWGKPCAAVLMPFAFSGSSSL